MLGEGEPDGGGEPTGGLDGILHTALPVLFPTPPTAAALPHTFTGTMIGTVGWLPEPIPPELTITLLLLELGETIVHTAPPVLFWTPPTAAVLPHALTGTVIGTCPLFPDATPPELTVALVALVLPPVVHAPPVFVSRNAIALAEFTHALTGTLIGVWAVLPEPIPPEFTTAEVADDPPGPPWVVVH